MPGSDAGRLRIAMLVRELPVHSETFIVDQIRGLREIGHDVTVCALYEGDPAEGYPGSVARHARYLIGPHRSFGAKWLRALGRAVRALTEPAALARLAPAAAWNVPATGEAIHAIPVLRGHTNEFDVVHAHFGPTGLLALLLRRMRLLSAPLVTTFHGYDLTGYTHLHGDDTYRPLFAAGEAFTVNSKFTKQRAVALGAPAHKVHRIPMGADVSAIPFRPSSWLGDNPVRLLSVGRLQPVKGFRYGLGTAAELADRGRDVQYTIVGAGPLDAFLREEAKRLGIEDRVRFTGALSYEAVLKEYDRHDIFLMPGVVTTDGQQEAQGRVLVEAQASGLPVVGTRVGGIPETVANGAGILVGPNDPKALADAVETLLESPERLPEMGRAGRQYVEEHFEARKLLDDLVAVYRAAMTDPEMVA